MDPTAPADEAATPHPAPTAEPEKVAHYERRAPVRRNRARPRAAPITEPEKLAHYVRKAPVRGADWAIAEIGRRQHSRVARWQLLRVGVTDGEIRRRLERGSLHIVANGVYAVGTVVRTLKARWMTAVLQAGPGAALSHRSAAALGGFRPYSGTPEVTIAADRRSRRKEVIYHQATLPPGEVTTIDGIPCTSAVRTLFDLGNLLTHNQLKVALHEAEVERRLYGTLTLADLVARYPGRRGIRTVKRVLAHYALGADVLRNEFEADFQDFREQVGLPQPRTNHPVSVQGTTYVPDCVWPEHGVIVELDGRGAHDVDERFDSDRRRDRILQTAGWSVVRVTPRLLYLERDELAADLNALLAHRAPEHRSSGVSNPATSAAIGR